MDPSAELILSEAEGLRADPSTLADDRVLAGIVVFSGETERLVEWPDLR